MNKDWAAPNQPVTPFFKSQINSKKFPVTNIIISLSRRKPTGKKKKKKNIIEVYHKLRFAKTSNSYNKLASRIWLDQDRG